MNTSERRGSPIPTQSCDINGKSFAKLSSVSSCAQDSQRWSLRIVQIVTPHKKDGDTETGNWRLFVSSCFIAVELAAAAVEREEFFPAVCETSEHLQPFRKCHQILTSIEWETGGRGRVGGNATFRRRLDEISHD